MTAKTSHTDTTDSAKRPAKKTTKKIIKKAPNSGASTAATPKRTTPPTSKAPTRTATGTTRLEMRIAPQDKELIERAARASRVTISAFVLQVTRQAAEDVLRRDQVTVVPPDFYEAMIASLEAPAERNEPLAEAARRSREVLTKK
ncbi:DUF1778 domain-containing protein [Streptodolium elevatio]|uniref:DUF1778 domain-containing protein n=1 Tax=Streptodolium elevatio TaxID=3157996 RepID=A0ABV3DL80_9ACTN